MRSSSSVVAGRMRAPTMSVVGSARSVRTSSRIARGLQRRVHVGDHDDLVRQARERGVELFGFAARAGDCCSATVVASGARCFDQRGGAVGRAAIDHQGGQALARVIGAPQVTKLGGDESPPRCGPAPPRQWPAASSSAATAAGAARPRASARRRPI
jgi:hypothetical protein